MASQSTVAVASGMGAVLGGALQMAQAATPTEWVTTIDPGLYGSSGTITFNDWGYAGPTGAGANDFLVGSGFDANRIGQIQTVVTRDPDWLTRDPSKDVLRDMRPPSLSGMFQPYAISDAKGWCGSMPASGPNALEAMAGQVSFDFASDAYLVDGTPTPGMGGGTQIVPDFAMRSYGSYSVSVTFGADTLSYAGSVVGNNNSTVNPLDAQGVFSDGAADPAYRNLVSFLGAGVVHKGV